VFKELGGGGSSRIRLLSCFGTLSQTVNQATAIGNVHEKFGEDRKISSGDMLAHKQTDRQTTDTLISILRVGVSE